MGRPPQISYAQVEAVVKELLGQGVTATPSRVQARLRELYKVGGGVHRIGEMVRTVQQNLSQATPDDHEKEPIPENFEKRGRRVLAALMGQARREARGELEAFRGNAESRVQAAETRMRDEISRVERLNHELAGRLAQTEKQQLETREQLSKLQDDLMRAREELQRALEQRDAARHLLQSEERAHARTQELWEQTQQQLDARARLDARPAMDIDTLTEAFARAMKNTRKEG